MKRTTRALVGMALAALTAGPSAARFRPRLKFKPRLRRPKTAGPTRVPPRTPVASRAPDPLPVPPRYSVDAPGGATGALAARGSGPPGGSRVTVDGHVGYDRIGYPSDGRITVRQRHSSTGRPDDFVELGVGPSRFETLDGAPFRQSRVAAHEFSTHARGAGLDRGRPGDLRRLRERYDLDLDADGNVLGGRTFRQSFTREGGRVTEVIRHRRGAADEVTYREVLPPSGGVFGLDG